MWNVSFGFVTFCPKVVVILILFFNCHTGGTESLISTMTPEKLIAQTSSCRMGGVMFWEKIVADSAEEGAV
jgi:hypothetical protein